MVVTLHLILVILAVVALALAAIGVVTPRSINLVALGLLCWLLSTLVAR